MTKEEAIYVLKNTAWLGSAELAGDVTEAVKMAVNALKRSETPNSSDTISRQAAIDAMCSACGYDCDKSEFVYDAPQDEQVILCPEHYALTVLPSAQPEIIRCKECKHWLDIDDGRQKHSMCADIYGDWFCADAERRTDERTN